MSDRIPMLVLGLGNVLCADDGVGVVALHQLCDAWDLPAGVVAIDGGTLGLALLPLVERADRVILIDAVRADGPPGTPVRLAGDAVAPAVRDRLSPHQIGVADLLGGAALLDRYPREVVIVGVVPASVDLAFERTPAVAAALPALVARVVAELADHGFAPVARGPTRAERRRDDAARALGL
jgi:hydrogenase maturation protease